MRASTSFATLARAVKPNQSTRIRQIRYASTSLRMPAMSPTMTEGGIAGWKKQEGESFVAGDILLEIETDKATIDVEAQDDGVMGKIIVKDGSQKIPVGQVIAILAEEGDDLSSISVPKELGPEGSSTSQPEPASASASASATAESKKGASQSSSGSGEQVKGEAKMEETTQTSGEGKKDDGHGHREIKHSKPFFPSVSRLLQSSNLSQTQISKIKGTGRDGMLTKGDVLLALGEIKNAYGSAEKLNVDILGASGKRKSEASETKATTPQSAPEKPLDAAGLKRLIVQGLSRAAIPSRPIVQHIPSTSDAEFDAILEPYATLLPAPQPDLKIPGLKELAAIEGHRGGNVKKDEWAGLF